MSKSLIFVKKKIKILKIYQVILSLFLKSSMIFRTNNNIYFCISPKYLLFGIYRNKNIIFSF
jgi:hypothetical protein